MVKALISFLIIFISCTPTRDIITSGGLYTYAIDFRKYTENDFLITTEAPNGDYKTIGLLEISFDPEVKEITNIEFGEIKDDPNSKYNAHIMASGSGVKYYAVEKADVQLALDEIYKVSTEWGANAIFNLNISTQIEQDVLRKVLLTVSGLAVTIEQ